LPTDDAVPGPPPLRLVDSITELGPADAGCLAVCGSHGGASSARYAIAARPLFTVFNDAGVGLDQAGLVALDQLQQHGLAACTVSYRSARIGEAASTLATGVVSHCNALASSRGVAPGHSCRQALGTFGFWG
jgi:hypothetical protein